MAADNEYVEKLIFFYVIKDYSLVNKYQENYFSSEGLKRLFGIVKPYIMKYKEEPTEELVNMLIRRDGRFEKELDPIIVHSLWQLKSELERCPQEWLDMSSRGYAEWNNLMYGIRRMHEYILTTQYEVTPESAHEYVQKVKMMFSSDTNFDLSSGDGGVDFFNPKSHKMSIVETRPTGYRFFDQCLNGGWAKKTLNVIMGPPKVGKSMWLCNLAANSVTSGDHSIYISLEMSTEIVNQRIGANMLNIPISTYKEYAMDEARMLEKFREYEGQTYGRHGELIVQEFPTSSADVYDIESFILSEEQKRSTETVPFKFRNVFIDYVNIMADARHANAGDTYIKIKNICEDLRAMSQRNDWCVISLTQTNRQGMGASDLDMTSVAESAGLLATVDSLFGIICTTIMKAMGVYYIKAVALRNSPHMGDRKKYLFSGDYLRIKEDDTEPIIQEGQQLPSEMTALAPSEQENGNKRRPWTPNKNNSGGGHSSTQPQPRPQTTPQMPTPTQSISPITNGGVPPVGTFSGTGFNTSLSNSNLFS